MMLIYILEYYSINHIFTRVYLRNFIETDDLHISVEFLQKAIGEGGGSRPIIPTLPWQPV